MKIISADQLPDSFFAYRDTLAQTEVRKIIAAVRERGDHALREFTQQFDRAIVRNIQVDPSELQEAVETADETLCQAILSAADNLRDFAQLQRDQLQNFEVELKPGVFTGQRVSPLQRAGVYVPGGRFPLISTLLMGVVPAQVAGVKEIFVCSPPGEDGEINRQILLAAALMKVDRVFRVGGAQAIAAMAYGTESIPGVDKIVGPGNQYVTQAKKEVFGIVGIDLIAGPSEVLIIADDSADAELVAADLLAQAEHDEQASAILLTPSRALAESVIRQIHAQLETLATAETAGIALEENSCIVVVKDLAQAVEICNRRAPEHLEVQVKDPSQVITRLHNYGSIFCGEMTAEVLGDYSSGINHTLPTNTTARYRGGLSVMDFLKVQTSLSVDRRGLKAIGPVARKLATAEGLPGHVAAVTRRLNKLT